MGEERATKHTAMLLALGDRPTAWRESEAWDHEAFQWLTEQGMAPKVARRMRDDFIIWRGEMESILVMQRILGSRYHAPPD